MNANMLRRTTAATGRPPHLVFVLADDLGFHGVGYRNAMLHTPTIDALASDGLRLDSFYTAKLCGAEHNRREEITRCSWQAPCLFDVEADPEERRDLAAAMPSKVAEMKDRVRQLSGASAPGYRARHFGVALMPNRSKNSYCAAAAAHSGFMVPWR